MPNFLKKPLLAIALFSLGFLSQTMPAEALAKSGEIKFFLDVTSIVADKFEIEAVLDSEEPINALEGEIVFLSDRADLELINDGNSIINFWIERPRATEGGRIEFAGIIPGGFQGGKGRLFTMVFKSKNQLAAGEKISSFIAAQKISGFLNNDRSSAAKLASSPLDLVIPSKTGEVKPKDNAPPENFTPEIDRDPLMFAGKYFLVFATQDKGSGVNYYEVKEGRRPFRQAESPYVLENQLLTEWIFVRAVDYAGNAHEAAVAPLKYGFKYEKLPPAPFMVLIGLAIFAALSMFIILRNLLLRPGCKYGKH